MKGRAVTGRSSVGQVEVEEGGGQERKEVGKGGGGTPQPVSPCGGERWPSDKVLDSCLDCRWGLERTGATGTSLQRMASCVSSLQLPSFLLRVGGEVGRWRGKGEGRGERKGNCDILFANRV